MTAFVFYTCRIRRYAMGRLVHRFLELPGDLLCRNAGVLRRLDVKKPRVRPWLFVLNVCCS